MATRVAAAAAVQPPPPPPPPQQQQQSSRQQHQQQQQSQTELQRQVDVMQVSPSAQHQLGGRQLQRAATFASATALLSAWLCASPHTQGLAMYLPSHTPTTGPVPVGRFHPAAVHGSSGAAVAAVQRAAQPVQPWGPAAAGGVEAGGSEAANRHPGRAGECLSSSSHGSSHNSSSSSSSAISTSRILVMLVTGGGSFWHRPCQVKQCMLAAVCALLL